MGTAFASEKCGDFSSFERRQARCTRRFTPLPSAATFPQDFAAQNINQNETKGVADNPDGFGPVNVTILTFVTVFTNVILNRKTQDSGSVV